MILVHSDTNKASNFLAKKIATMLVGKATAKPIIHPCKNFERNISFQPILIDIIVKVITVSNARVIKTATTIPEYFLSIFKSLFT